MASFSRHDRRRGLAAIRWPLRLTYAGIVAERLVLALWPLFSVVILALSALMLGLQDLVAIEAVWGCAVLVALGAVGSFAYALRRFRLPSRQEALDLLDASMPGRPIQTLMDDQAVGETDAASAAVWRAHQARMAERAAAAQPVTPVIRTARRDPYALRFVAILAFAVALIFGSLWRVGSVAEMAPGLGDDLARGPVWEGWIEPPRYTGRPTLYLNDLRPGKLTVPVGSLVTIRLYGEIGALTLAETVSGRTGEVPPASDPAHDFTVLQEGTLGINGPGGRGWAIAVRPDDPPNIYTNGPVETSALGEMTLPFRATDDYGVEGGEVRIALDLGAVDRRYGLARAPEDRPDITAPLPVPITGGRTGFDQDFVENFSKHPWANLPVTLRLTAIDAAEQQSFAEPIEMVLPGRRFFDPMAAALIEMRRDLLWNKANARDAAVILRAVSHLPKDAFRTEMAALRLRMIIGRMETLARYEMPGDSRDELADGLWELALLMEEGDLADALERMQRAQERLQEAMRNGASDEEIAELMRELRQATDDYLRQLSRQQQLQADENGQQQNRQSADNSMQMTQDDLQRMMDRIQELMEQGRMAEAEQALQELQELLENMRVTQGQQGEGNSPGQQAMEGLAETLREQQGLSDQAFRDLQEQFNPGANAGENDGNEGRNGGQGRGQSHEGQGGQGQGQDQAENDSSQQGGGQAQPGGDAESLDQSLAGRQRALRDELRRQQGSLPGAGTPEGNAARDALDRASEAMKNAENALRDDRYADAIDEQSRAMDALREGIQNLGEAMAQEQQQNQQGQGESPGDRTAENNDPLGRDSNQSGAHGTEGGFLDGDQVRRRAQELLDEIRRRSAQADRPENERDYLNRLLDRF